MKRWSSKTIASMATIALVASVVTLALVAVTPMAAAGTPQESQAPRYLDNPGRSDDLPYSNAVLVGDTLYLAGAIGIDPETGAPPAEIEDEVRFVMDSMKQRLERVEMTMDDLVSVQVFCPDLTLYDRFNAVYRTYFEDHFPARGFIGSGPLLRGGHFEVMGIAVKS